MRELWRFGAIIILYRFTRKQRMRKRHLPTGIKEKARSFVFLFAVEKDAWQDILQRSFARRKTGTAAFAHKKPQRKKRREATTIEWQKS